MDKLLSFLNTKLPAMWAIVALHVIAGTALGVVTAILFQDFLFGFVLYVALILLVDYARRRLSGEQPPENKPESKPPISDPPEPKDRPL